MSPMFSDHVYCMEERGERIERVVEIYESVDAITGYKHSREQEDAATRKKLQTQNTAGRRCFHWTAVCLILMSLLLLASVVTLWVRFNIQTTEKKQLQTGYDNLTVEQTQLQTSYDNLTKVLDQLQTKYENLTISRAQLQTSHYNLTNVTGQLQTRYGNLTMNRAQLQTSYDNLTSHYTNLTKERNSLQQKIEELERGLTALGWRYFNSSIYYMSTEKLSWIDSRQNCEMKGADLVSINSEQEQNFVEELKQGNWTWIGLNDTDAEGQWKWVDGTQLTTEHWEPGEPGGSSSENCAVFRELWHDYTCSEKLAWICEKRI